MTRRTHRMPPRLIVASVAGAALVILGALGWPPRGGSRSVGTLENIDGIPYPKHGPAVRITEWLAHMDVYLREPVLARVLTLTITFTPHATESLAVGVRENAFWLSYPRQVFFTKGATTQPNLPHTATVAIPLTDKLPAEDRSVDIMFFAEPAPAGDPLANRALDTTDWELNALEAHVAYTLPSWAQFKDFARSVLIRERLL